MANRKGTVFQFLLVAMYLAGAVAVVSALLRGASYYVSPYLDRPHLAEYKQLRPAGMIGHAYGVVGSALLLLLLLYSVRKRSRGLEGWGTPAQWLQVHICFGIIGPCLVILHTSFKVQGLVAVSFWSMTAVALSGIFGRWLYQHIPRNFAGHELTRKEIEALERDLANRVASETDPRAQARWAARRARLDRDAKRLETIRGIFHWWHAIHKPFAIIMLVIMAVHVVVAVSLGYVWLF